MRSIGEVATAVTSGEYGQSVTVEARGEVALLKENINKMIVTLADTTRVNQEQDWLKSNLTRFTRMLQGQRNLLGVARQIMSELAKVIGAQHGVFYMNEKTAEGADGDAVRLKLYAAYAYKERKNVASEFRLGEGLVGQCALEKERIVLSNVPADYIQVNSGLGQATPLNIAVVPVVFEGDVKGVVELASFQEFTPTQLSFLEQLFESLGIVIASIEAAQRTELLQQSQGLTEELQTQQEELQQTNEELEETARQVTRQKSEVERKNQEVELAKASLEEKAEQLALTSKYKSEFLANMSHELRTPLNSLLILSQQLTDNPEENLSDKQVEFARTIHASGNDLLALINEVLDLAKIESGTMGVEPAEVGIDGLTKYINRSFRQMALEGELDFEITVGDDVPSAIVTDNWRLQQVLRNLLSNAFKFTDKGNVTLQIERVQSGWSPGSHTLSAADDVVAFRVVDNGIGIPESQQRLVFEAFQQAEGGTNRKYGGTGLGLSISREIATLLGGELRVESTPGEGSTFTLYLPRVYREVQSRSARTAPAQRPSNPAPESPRLHTSSAPPKALPFGDERRTGAGTSRGMPVVTSGIVPDDRDGIEEGDRTLLVVEDDEKFARILVDHGRAKGFKVLAALTGQEDLALAARFKPDAITLDLKLPDADGWVILDRLKHDPNLRHIPVHVVSGDEKVSSALGRGALAYLQKPVEQGALDAALASIADFVDRKVKQLLVVEDDDDQRESIVELIGNSDVETTAVGTATEALTLLEEGHFDCMVLDLKLPDMSGFELVKLIRDDEALMALPIVIYTGRDLTEEEETALKRLTETIIVKGAQSPERLLDETALFRHRVEAKLPEVKRKMIRKVYQSDPQLEGKTVLIVDDDVRNIFATTSVRERHHMQVLHAENGLQGLKVLEENSGIDLVLMDIMMPETDGYEAMRTIRANETHKKLPIIALTAKAMKGDREKCIRAGASDYIVKPLDSEQLLSLLRVWLYRSE